MRVLFACKLKSKDWEEELITGKEHLIERAKIWAQNNGFDRLRVVEITNEFPDFSKTVNKL